MRPHPEVIRVSHVSRKSPHRVPRRESPLGAVRVRHVSRVPKTIGPSRKPPVAPRVPSEPDRETTRVPLCSTVKASPGDPRALGEYATCRSSREQNFLLIIENSRKCLELLKFIEIRVLVKKIPNQFSQLAFDKI